MFFLLLFFNSVIPLRYLISSIDDVNMNLYELYSSVGYYLSRELVKTFNPLNIKAKSFIYDKFEALLKDNNNLKSFNNEYGLNLNDNVNECFENQTIFD